MRRSGLKIYSEGENVRAELRTGGPIPMKLEHWSVLQTQVASDGTKFMMLECPRDAFEDGAPKAELTTIPIREPATAPHPRETRDPVTIHPDSQERALPENARGPDLISPGNVSFGAPAVETRPKRSYYKPTGRPRGRPRKYPRME